MSRQTTILVIVFIVLSFIAGLGAGLKIGGGAVNPGLSLKPGENTYQAGWDAAKKRLSDSGFCPTMPSDMEIKNLSGEVKEVSGNKIILKTRPMEPLADPSLDTRTIVIDNDTKIYQLEQRDPAVVQKEMEEFQKIMQERMKDPATAKPATPPETFIKKEVKISDLKAGQVINVISGSDVRSAKEIKAVEITVNQMINLPPVVMPNASTSSSAVDTSLPPMPPTPAGQAK